MSQAETSAGYNLFNGGSDWFRLQEAKYRARPPTTSAAASLLISSWKLKQAYIEVLRTKRTVETEKASVELLEQQLHDTQLRLRSGTGSPQRPVASGSGAGNGTTTSCPSQQGRHEISRQALAGRWGGHRQRGEVGRPHAGACRTRNAVDSMQQEMFLSRSELKFLNSLLAAEVAGRKAVRGDLLPDVDLVLSYDRFGNNACRRPATPITTANQGQWCEASWTFSAASTPATSWSDAGRRSAPGKRRSKRLRTTDPAVADALEAFRVSEENLTQRRPRLIQAEENYRVNENRYKAKVATTVDLLDAQEYLTRARNERVKAHYDLHLSAVAIETGPGTRTDTTRIIGTRDAGREVKLRKD